MTQPLPTPVHRRDSLSERRRRERRALLVGLAVSLVVHVLAVGLFGGWLSGGVEQGQPTRQPRVYVPPTGMRAIDIAVSPATPAPTPSPEVPPRREPEARAPTRPAPVVAEAPDDAVADATAAERLAPRVVDPRLYEPLVVLPWEPTLADVEARIWAAVELLSDSALAEAEAALRTRDWTVEDADGGRWGISPGQLHLGKITVPLPIEFPVSAEAAARQAQWYELDRQLERSRILESFEERVRAIRERREKERSESKGNGGG